MLRTTLLGPRVSTLSPLGLYQTWTFPSCNELSAPRRRVHQRPTQPEPSHLDWPTTRSPTPYEILRIPRDAPYTKTRYYRLAKLYHPDMHRCQSSLHAHLTPAACVERYRLVVRAHDILSNPAKRRAYDTYGAGWTDRAPLTNEAYREWRSAHDSAAQNGTWEDWEAWYDRRDGKKQETVYMSHGAFATILVFAISLGVVAQANRAGVISSDRQKMMQNREHEVALGLDRRASSTAEMGREERVASFIRDRENAHWGFHPDPAKSLSK